MDIKRRNKSGRKDSQSTKSDTSNKKDGTEDSDKAKTRSSSTSSKSSTSKKGVPGTKVPPTSAELFPKHRLWSRTILVLGVLVVVYFTQSKVKESIYAEYKEDLTTGKGFDVKCTFKYTESLKQYPGVSPSTCGRIVVDKIYLDSNPFLHVVKQIISKHFRNAPPHIVILDLGKWTMNSYKSLNGATEFTELVNYIPLTKDFTDAYKLLHRRLKQIIREHFQVNVEKIYLAEPSFITILTGKDSGVDYASQFMVDQEMNNGSFHYSGKVFISDYIKEIEGPRFIFADKDNIHRVVHPRKGRALVYTSGPENIYFLEPSTQGSLVILTMGFTANPKQAFRHRALLE